MRQALALRSGTELDIYLVTGKLKHPRVFWLEIGDKCVCWGKRRCAASPPPARAFTVLPACTDSARIALHVAGTPESSSGRS